MRRAELAKTVVALDLCGTPSLEVRARQPGLLSPSHPAAQIPISHSRSRPARNAKDAHQLVNVIAGRVYIMNPVVIRQRESIDTKRVFVLSPSTH